MSLINEKSEEIRVAQYLRMSTGHQKFSIENQADFIRNYARSHNMTVVHTYEDAGKSGISLAGRSGLKMLLEDVLNHNINIEAVLVYDVSRFGRFTDPEEAAYYSYILKAHNVRIIYCADPLPDEYPEVSMLALPVLRYGAACYSKNLSEKVYHGMINLVKRGYRQGGICGYGLRRLLLDENSQIKTILSHGERKSLLTDRVKLIPGPKEEVDIVNEIYDLFIEGGLTEREISDRLNSRGVSGNNNKSWTAFKVNEVLTSEKYIGNNIYNRRSCKLKSKCVRNPEEEWIKCINAFEPVVSLTKFEKAKRIIDSKRKRNFSDDDIVEHLKEQFKLNGKINAKILIKCKSGPGRYTISSRFGGLLPAYINSGIPLVRNFDYVNLNKRLKAMKYEVVNAFESNLIENNCAVTLLKKNGILINDELRIEFVIARCYESSTGVLKWKVNLSSKRNADLIIIFRMNNTNSAPVDCYIIPSIDNVLSSFVLKQNNPIGLECYRYDDLSNLIYFLKRTSVIRSEYE